MNELIERKMKPTLYINRNLTTLVIILKEKIKFKCQKMKTKKKKMKDLLWLRVKE